MNSSERDDSAIYSRCFKRTLVFQFETNRGWPNTITAPYSSSNVATLGISRAPNYCQQALAESRDNSDECSN
jgi:hypothetical protein